MFITYEYILERIKYKKIVARKINKSKNYFEWVIFFNRRFERGKINKHLLRRLILWELYKITVFFFFQRRTNIYLSLI